jgi:hypothetical protein
MVKYINVTNMMMQKVGIQTKRNQQVTSKS